MKLTKAGHAVLAASFLLCGSAVTQAQVETQQLADRWVAAYNSHDREALAELYSDDAKLMVHGAPTVFGNDAIEEFWADDFLEADPLTLLTVTNSVNGIDMTLVHGDYRVINRGDGLLLGQGRFSHIWRRDGSQWQLTRDLRNQPYEPYMETAGAASVQQLADRWTEAYNNHDRAALEAVYADDGSLMLHGGPTISERSEIGDFWALDFQEDNPLTVLTVTHAVDGIDMVLVHGNYEVVGRVDGLLLGAGRFAHIWLEDDSGEWHLDTDLWLERGPF